MQPWGTKPSTLGLILYRGTVGTKLRIIYLRLIVRAHYTGARYCACGAPIAHAAACSDTGKGAQAQAMLELQPVLAASVHCRSLSLSLSP